MLRQKPIPTVVTRKQLFSLTLIGKTSSAEKTSSVTQIPLRPRSEQLRGQQIPR